MANQHYVSSDLQSSMIAVVIIVYKIGTIALGNLTGVKGHKCLDNSYGIRA